MNSLKLPLYICGFVVCALLCTCASAATVTLEEMYYVTGTGNVGSDSTDYLVFDPDGNITLNGGPGMFSISSDGSGSPDGSGGSFQLNWTNGIPVSSGTTTNYYYYGFGSGYSTGAATYMDLNMVMPDTHGTLRVWIRPVGNTSSISYTMTVADGLFSDSYTNSDASFTFFEFDLSGFTADETVKMRIDDVSGTNVWHNIGILGAEFIVPEPATLALLAGGVVLLGLKRKRK